MKVLIIFFAALTTAAFSQEIDLLQFLPYKTGNMWEYYDSEYPDTSQTFNIKDSVDADGNIYYTQYSRRINPIQYPSAWLDTMTYKIDSSFNVFGTYMQDYSERLIYKLNAKQGEQWVLKIHQDSTQVYGYEMARVEKIENGELIYNSGIYTTFKVFVYYYAIDSTDTSGLARYGDVLAYGFGLWGRGGGIHFRVGN